MLSAKFSIDETGVALAAIKGLHQLVQAKDREIDQLKRRLKAIELTLGMSSAGPSE